MTVISLMNPTPMTIGPDVTFGDALQILIDKHVNSLPVVDTAGIYRGMFDLYDVWKQLLPRAILLQEKFLEDLAFFSGTHKELKEKLAAASSRPASEFLDDAQSPTLRPETPVEEAILHLFRHERALPVVEKDTRRLLGIVTSREILNALR